MSVNQKIQVIKLVISKEQKKYSEMFTKCMDVCLIWKYLFFGNQSHDSHVWIDYIHLDKKKICRKDFACRNACLLPKFCHHSMFQCYFVVNGNKRKTVTKGRSVNLIHIRPCHIPSQLSAHGNITELRKMQWLLFNLFFPSNFEYHLCSGHMFESSICGHCYRNDFF